MICNISANVEEVRPQGEALTIDSVRKAIVEDLKDEVIKEPENFNIISSEEENVGSSD